MIFIRNFATVKTDEKVTKNKNKMKKKTLLLAFVLTLCLPMLAQQFPYQNPNLSARERAKDLCSRLTLEEKAKLMMDVSPAIERLGIPAFQWWNEALHGVGRNGYATVYPITMAMAASWDDDLLQKVFTQVSDEARAKAQLAKKSGTIRRYQSLSFWTPNINIFRDPRWGRGQETYGEDPFLTTKMGLAVVRGLQGPEDSHYKKLLACAKHFAIHSGPEWNRHSFNIEDVDPRDLWETYMPAFKSLVQEGKVAEVMCAYQRWDGEPCCGSNRLLQQILRNDWGFDGLVVSDCGAIGDFWIKGRHEVTPDAASASAKAVISGTDVECGSNYKSLPDAVKAGYITEDQINTSVLRLLECRFILGDFDADELVEWTKIPASVIASAEHKQTALEMAREGMTLLMNKNNTLPLDPENTKIAVLGPNANDSVMLWGNYTGYPTQTTTILQGLKQMAKHVKYVEGCGLTRNEVMLSRYNEITTPDGERGMRATYWNNAKLEGEPVATQILAEPINQSNGGATVFAPGVELENFSARYEGTFRPTRSEELLLSVSVDDMVKVWVNDKLICDLWKSRQRVQDAVKPLTVEAGKEYKIVIEFAQTNALALMKFDIAKKLTATAEQIISKVQDADVIVFAGGISPRVEGEEMKVSEPGFKGGDRTDIELPQAQRDMISALHKAGKRIVFVNCSGGAMALVPEMENADAILQAWYAGEKGGQAVAEVLLGKVNPSGKLPVTFYKDMSQLPDFLDYSMKNRTYRYFKGEPAFVFGHGLSYTTFSYDKPKYKNGKLTFTLTNTGKKAGTEVAQVYMKRLADTDGPIKSLRGYQRVTLQPGESRTVTISLPRESFEGWDAQTNTMRVVGGKYELMVGGSSADDQLQKLTVKIK